MQLHLGAPPKPSRAYRRIARATGLPEDAFEALEHARELFGSEADRELLRAMGIEPPSA